MKYELKAKKPSPSGRPSALNPRQHKVLRIGNIVMVLHFRGLKEAQRGLIKSFS
jgi:hypothetical protein